jgi:hypothetical protein
LLEALQKFLAPAYDCTLDWYGSYLIFKQIEIDDPKEITEEFLMSELHPIKQAHRTQFNKPKPPSNRRPKT